ncbi:MAG: TetR/AcrR family transcriptional regulator, partial [Chloroflexia bacterium]|nr:TetR/AcrR family transcriptional regulator [Chloroflexia bacterium]
MNKRGAAVADTRRRIVEATLALHSAKGVFDTTWKDIAQRADVSVATVYKHFPSLDELVPACGALIMAITDPPTIKDAPRVVGSSPAVEDRMRSLISALFDFYER